MPAKSDPRAVAVDNYYYRRSLSARDLLPAIGVGVAAGALAFYVARIVLQRAPVTAEGFSLSKGRTSLPRVLPGPRAS
jgi:hypothetical protein